MRCKRFVRSILLDRARNMEQLEMQPSADKTMPLWEQCPLIHPPLQGSELRVPSKISAGHRHASRESISLICPSY